jgi:Methyltransferase domain
MTTVTKRLQYRLALTSRRRKLDLFWSLLRPSAGQVVLNLGATPPHLGHALTGNQHGGCIEQPEQDTRWDELFVVGINRDESNARAYRDYYKRTDRIAFVADGCQLPFADKSVDIVFSNAVIEHVPAEKQELFAQEIMRVGRAWFITTPNYWYPFEFHYKLPFVHYLPQPLQSRTCRRLSDWPVNEPISLLSARKLLSLFPGSELVRSRVTFWPETLIVHGHA